MNDILVDTIFSVTGNNGVTCIIEKRIVDSYSTYILYVDGHGTSIELQDKNLEKLIRLASDKLN